MDELFRVQHLHLDSIIHTCVLKAMSQYSQDVSKCKLNTAVGNTPKPLCV